MDNQKAFENLRDTTQLLNLSNLNYFLIDGTLLGIIRENNFIGHDTDIDLGVYMEEWDLDIFCKFVYKMMYAGFILYHSFGVFGKHFEAAFYRNGIKIDLFFYYKVGDKIRFNAFLNGGRTLPNDILTYEYDAYNFDRLGFVDFNGYNFRVPSNPLEVLEAKYGVDWRVPNKKWNWATSPKNLISQGKFL